MKEARYILSFLITTSTLTFLSSCSDDKEVKETYNLEEKDDAFGQANDVFTAEEWYPGGELGTTTKRSYSAPAPAVDQLADGQERFKHGEDFFEHLYTLNTEPRKGLGPAWVRSSCIHCHPGYGHGKRQEQYRANEIGNGYLLVIYHNQDGPIGVDGKPTYTKNSYISEVTGMPQTQAMAPFTPPIDESQIQIEWKRVETMPSGLPMTFDDGESYELIYPEVTIPQTAFNTNPKPENYEVRLESTIGIYGTGLLDAITDEDMEAQWRNEGRFVELNPAMWDKANNKFAASAYYSAAYNDLGKHRGDHGPVKRFTYAMTRGSLQDGAGSNAIWNITNVTRSDRHFLYTSAAWAKAQSEDPNVIKYIKENGASEQSLLHPYYADGSDSKIADAVRNLLDPATNQFDNKWHSFAPEMNDKQYYQFMVWHRGLAVPAARNLNNGDVQRGKELFSQIGCAQCHRPSWTTGNDDMWIDSSIKAYAQSIGKDASKMLPRYPGQTIWPYTDMVQHRLFMMNDLRTGWCRTTPLWGRGLSRRLTGADDRLHDCRARTVLEAIMWHGYSKQSDAYRATEKFYHLSKEDRKAVIKFIEAI